MNYNMTIILEKKAVKDFKNLENWIQNQIREKLNFLKKYPDTENLDIKKLKTPFEWFRLRIWNYRILFIVLGDEIKVYSIKHRRDAYK